MSDDTIHIGPEPGPQNARTDAREKRDYRIEALAFLCADFARRGEDGARRSASVLAVHPDAAAIRAIAKPASSLSVLLYDELADYESERLGVAVDRNLQNHEPFAYYLRRRELAHHAEVIAVWRELPPVFVAIARSNAEHIQSSLSELGARMIAAVVLTKQDVDVHALLRPLPSRTSRRVLELIADTNEKRSDPPLVLPHDLPSAALWHGLLERIVDDPKRGPKRAADLMGRTLLATLFQRLGEDLRKRARELAVTVVVKKLNESEVIDIEPDASAWALAEAMADGVFLVESNGGGA